MESLKTFFDKIKTYIFCSKVPSKCRKCHFRDPNFKMGFQTYIFCSKVPSKCRKCRFRDPNFKQFPGGECPRTPLQLCRHYDLPLTKILATPLYTVFIHGLFLRQNQSWLSYTVTVLGCLRPPLFVCHPNLSISSHFAC